MSYQNQFTTLQSLEALNRLALEFGLLIDEEQTDDKESNTVQKSNRLDAQSIVIEEIVEDMQANVQNRSTTINSQRGLTDAVVDPQNQEPPSVRKRTSGKRKVIEKSTLKKERKESKIKNFPFIVCSQLKDIQKQIIKSEQGQRLQAYSQLFLNALKEKRTLRTINRFLIMKSDEQNEEISGQLELLMNRRGRRTDTISIEEVAELQEKAREEIIKRKEWLLQDAQKRKWDQKHKDFRNGAYLKYIRQVINQINRNQAVGMRMKN